MKSVKFTATRCDFARIHLQAGICSKLMMKFTHKGFACTRAH